MKCSCNAGYFVTTINETIHFYQLNQNCTVTHKFSVCSSCGNVVDFDKGTSNRIHEIQKTFGLMTSDELKNKIKELNFTNQEFSDSFVKTYTSFKASEIIEIIDGVKIQSDTQERLLKLFIESSKDNIEKPTCISDKTYENNLSKVKEVVKGLQSCIMAVGGSKISLQDLSNRTLNEVLFSCAANGIKVKIFVEPKDIDGF